MATADRFEWNMAGLADLSTEVARVDCAPAADKAMAEMIATAPEVSGDYKASFRRVSDPRTGPDDWAHEYVVNDSPHAGHVEARHGTMLRALNGL